MAWQEREGEREKNLPLASTENTASRPSRENYSGSSVKIVL